MYSRGLFHEEENDDTSVFPRLPLTDLSHEYLALVRSATSELPYVRDKLPYDGEPCAHPTV